MRLVLLLCALAFPAGAQTDLGAMTPAERTAFGAEVRAFLMDEPDVVQAALAKPNYAAEAYQEKADADLLLLDSLSDEVLAGNDIALFVTTDCEDCAKAEMELRIISKRSGVNFILHDMMTTQGAALANQLGMDEAPFYVMPRMILRGHMPEIVLGRYLSR